MFDIRYANITYILRNRPTSGFFQSFISKTVVAVFRYDHVVQKGYAAGLENLLQLFRGIDVGVSRQGASGRMIMYDNESAGLLLDGFSGYAVAIQHGGIEATAAHLLLGYDIIGPVEKEYPAFFVIKSSENRQHHPEYCLWR